MSTAPGAPPVLRSAHVARPLEETFTVFTRQIGAWWPLPTHGVFGDLSGGISFENGRLVERAVDGRVSVWGEVLAWEPPHRLVYLWHLRFDRSDATEVEVTFTSAGDGTAVTIEHRGWERLGERGRAKRDGNERGWGGLLPHFQAAASSDS